jgi:AraC-like DNA-binding protein
MPEPFSLTLLDAGLRGCAAGLLFLLGALVLRDRRSLTLARVCAVFTAGLIVQVLSSAPAFEAAVPRSWQAPLVGVSVGNAVLFWLFVLALFDDTFALRPWHIAAWFILFAVALFNCATGYQDTSALGQIAIGLQRSAPLACAGLAVFAAASTWTNDLVEPRRRVRMFIVVAGSAYTVAMFAIRLASPHGRLSEATATLDISVLLAIVSVVSLGLLCVVPSELFPLGERPAQAPVEEPVAGPVPVPGEPVSAAAASPALPRVEDQRVANDLQRAMAEDRVYREEGLTVAGLAKRLSVPEYRLRRHINQRLGYRNFNAYVNAFRLKEASSWLADPTRRELPVLTIALEAGFQSIGPFNRAFKAATGCTPTEFRRQHLADS